MTQVNQQPSGQQTQSAAASSKYVDLIQRSDKDKESGKAQYNADSAKLKLSGHILETQQEVSRGKQKVLDLKGAINFDPKAIIAAQIEVDEAQLGLQALNALMEELF